MFSQTVLDKIKTSAIQYASVINATKAPNLPLCERVSLLIGRTYNDKELERLDLVTKIISEISEIIRAEQYKARQNYSLYNSNRHIALHDLLNILQKKRKKLISAL